MPRFSYIHNVNFLSALPMILNETRQDCYLKGVWRINRLVFPKSGPSKIGPCTKYYLCKNTYLPPHSDNKSWQREGSTQINTLRNLPCCCGNPQLEKKKCIFIASRGNNHMLSKTMFPNRVFHELKRCICFLYDVLFSCSLLMVLYSLL